MKSFRYGDILDILKGSKIDYACMFMNVSNASYGDGSVQVTVELLAMDKTTKDDLNKLDVENTMMHVINDFKNVMRYSDRWQSFYNDIIFGSPARKYYDNFADVVTGWGLTITLDILDLDGICILPIVDYDYEQQVSSELCPTVFGYNLFVNGESYGVINVNVFEDINITT
jgi:hypothetical protein